MDNPLSTAQIIKGELKMVIGCEIYFSRAFETESLSLDHQ